MSIEFTAGGSSTASIKAHDAGFDETNFLAYVRKVHFAVAQAVSAGKPQGARMYVRDSLYPRLAADIAAHGPRQVDQAVDADGAVIAQAHSDASVDTVVVQLRSSILVGDRSTTHAAWTFQRSSQATTPAGGLDATAAATCPSCGAPLKIDDAGDCDYCRAPVTPAATQWALADIAPAQDLADVIAAVTLPARKAGRVVTFVIVAAILIGVVAAVVAIVGGISSSNSASKAAESAQSTAAAQESSALAQAGNAASSAESQVSQAVGNALKNVPTMPPATTPPPTVTAQLTLTGTINLSPSTLDSGEFTLNNHSDGSCLPASEPLKSITLDASFDDGSMLQGSFALGTPLSRGGSADLATGGAAILHFTGPTQAADDDEKWPMPAGQPGLVTVTLNADGSGTLKWQPIQPSEPNSNYDGTLSGLATWTCG
jgi:hypothetical protein